MIKKFFLKIYVFFLLTLFCFVSPFILLFMLPLLKLDSTYKNGSYWVLVRPDAKIGEGPVGSIPKFKTFIHKIRGGL